MLIFNKLEKMEKFNIDTKKGRNNFISLFSVLGIILNILLSVFKIIMGIISNSIAILTDGLNNLYDIFSSFISFVGIKLADKEADDGHPYGHGRIEYVASLFISIIVFLMGLEFLKASIIKIINPEEVFINFLMIVILVISILIKIYIYTYNKVYAKKLNSLSMDAVAADSMADVLITSLVVINALVFYIFKLNIDGYIGVLISLFVLYSGGQSAKEAIHILIGVAPRNKTFDRLEEFIVDGKQFLGIHHLIVHDYGPNCLMMTLHVEVAADFDFKNAYFVQNELEKSIKKEYDYNIFIKLEPVNYADKKEEVKELENKVQSYLKDYATISNFRVTDNFSHFIIFDAKLKENVGKLKHTEGFLIKEIKKHHPEYNVDINLKDL